MPLCYRMLLLAFVSMCVAVPGCLAQTRLELSPEAKGLREAACGVRAAAFGLGERTAVSQHALRMMGSCPDTGAHFLAREWALKSRDTSYVQAIADASKLLIDRRIANAALAVLSDRSLSRELRVLALDALASQISPTMLQVTGTFVQYPIRSIEPPHDIVRYGTMTHMGGTMPNPLFTLGREQLSTLELDEIVEAVKAMAAADPDKVLAGHVLGMLLLAEKYRREVPVREVRPIR